MLLMVRAAQDAVLDAVSEDRCSVGPTSPAGWTAAWVGDDAGAATLLGDHVTILETEDGIVIELVAAAVTSRWNLTYERAASPQLEEVASALAGLFATTRPGASDSAESVLEALRNADLDEEAVAEALGQILELPETWEPPPSRSVVAHRGNLAAARLGGSIFGPTFLTVVDPQWSVVTQPERPESYRILAGAVATAGSRRTNLDLALWRAPGSRAGFFLLRGDELLADATWNTGWRFTGDDPERADHHSLAIREVFDIDDQQMVQLRALLRADDRAEDPLMELTDLLSVPAVVLDHLEQGVGDDAELLPELSAFRAWWETVRGDPGHPPWAPRWLRWVGAIATGLAAFICAAMTLLGILVVATDGAILDEDPATTEDWVFIPVFAVLAVVLTATTFKRVRRARI